MDYRGDNLVLNTLGSNPLFLRDNSIITTPLHYNENTEYTEQHEASQDNEST